MNNNAATGSYPEDHLVVFGDSGVGSLMACKTPSLDKVEARKFAASVSAVAAASVSASSAANPRLQQWLKETERQREENNRAAFARWMEKCDSGLVKPSTLQNYPTATALRAQPPGAAAAAAAGAGGPSDLQQMCGDFPSMATMCHVLQRQA